MEVTLQSVFEAAMQLSAKDRLELASRLLEADTPDAGLFHIDDPQLIIEIERRCADPDIEIPWEELRNERASHNLPAASRDK